MTKHDVLDTLLVVVATRVEATAVESAMSLRGIATRVDRDVSRLIEFAGKLGGNPWGVYVHPADLVRAKEILIAKRLPDSASRLDPRSVLGM